MEETCPRQWTLGFWRKKEELPEKQVEQLHKIIGKLQVENDFLQEAWNKLKP